MSCSRFLLIITLVATPALFAAPIACVEAPLSTYTAQTEGCTLGAFTLKGFAWSSLDSEGYVPVSASAVMVTPSVSSNSIAVGFSSSAFSVTGLDKIRALLRYTIDPPPPILDDLNLEMDANTPEPPGEAIITADICAGEYFINSCPEEKYRFLQVDNFGPGNPLNTPVAVATFPPVYLIDVEITIVLNANGASSQIDGFGTTATASSGDPSQVVPEPTTAALLFTGLAGAIFIRRRKVSAGS